MVALYYIILLYIIIIFQYNTLYSTHVKPHRVAIRRHPHQKISRNCVIISNLSSITLTDFGTFAGRVIPCHF